MFMTLNVMQKFNDYATLTMAVHYITIK